MTAPGGPKRSTIGRIVAVSLVACGTALGAAAALNASASGGGGFFLIVVALAALFFVGGLFSWRGKRWAYVLGIVASVVVLLLFGSPTEILANPANQEFSIAFIFYVSAAVAIVYGAYGVYAGKREITSRASVGAFIALGVVVGGLLVGTFAGQTQSALLTGSKGDITIAIGAGSLTTGAFNPGNFTVKAGTTITWFNGDPATHTVTSTTGVFDSGTFPSGHTYSYKFNTPGTFPYYCVIHPNMKGTVIVTA
ncbi:MAG: cupredoxin family copper-binding protein [Thaumarchaeota archaeon]|nr:cupredoxin family copper-binding protein [Nitrososphaerota archaeon]